MNGLGGNTCIQDAFNLAWKLAAVLCWGAGVQLLDTYTAERQPVGRHVVERAIAGWRQNPEVVRALGVDPSAAPDVRQAQFDVLFEDSDAGEQRRAAFAAAKRSKDWSYHAHGTEMNQVYASSAVLDGGLAPPTYERDPELYYQPVSRPGARVPHAWVGFAGRAISTLDLCQPQRFTLLTRTRGRAWLQAAERVAANLGIPLAAFRIGPGGEGADLYGTWAETAAIGEAGAMLVRPDQHIAALTETMPPNPHDLLSEWLTRCLSLAQRTMRSSGERCSTVTPVSTNVRVT